VRDLASFFSEDGQLAQNLEGFELRPEQLEMAAVVERAIKKKGRAVVEAGTGTGKTLAYLIPAALSGKKTLVSTATKNLQEQIFYKDVPLLRSLGLKVDAAYLKGRGNYLCKYKYEDFARAPMFRSREDGKHFARIVKWVSETETGDKAELSDLPDDFPTWYDLSTNAESCLGSECRLFEECFVTKNRRDAADAQLLIVNHHLFFADLAVRSGGFGEVLPDVHVVIFDEAHHLESTATNFFGKSISQFRVTDLLADLDRALKEVSSPPLELYDSAGKSGDTVGALFKVLKRRLPKGGRSELPRNVVEDPEIGERVHEAVGALEALGGAISRTSAKLGEGAGNLSRRCTEIASDLKFVLIHDEPGWVYFSEVRGRRSDRVFLQACPIDMAETFVETLYPRHKTTVFTSATLAVDGAFHYFRSRMALAEKGLETLRLDSAFDYMEQALLYVPDGLPQPSAPGFVDEIAPRISELLEITGGRAFVLFTSYRNMKRCHELLADSIEQPVLVQGERSRSALLEDFKRQPSVLFATSSFWEGVDVQGDHLSLVIIDKLPFASPGDPLVKARIEFIREQGGEPFNNFQLPEAAITLKQGFGRLIRHRTDRGIVAILDRRLLDKGYGRVLINTLPRCRRTRSMDTVRRWWSAKSTQE